MEIRASVDSKSVTFIEENTIYRTRVLAPGILYFGVTGYVPYQFAQPSIGLAARELERAKRLVMFVDGREIAGMNTQYREEWTNWIRSNKSQFRALFLIKSALMAMVANVANMVAGLHVIETYSDPIQFEFDCAKLHPGFVHRRVLDSMP